MDPNDDSFKMTTVTLVTALVLTMHPKDRGPNEGVTFEVDHSFQFSLTVGNKIMMT